MLRFVFFDIYKNANTCYQKYDKIFYYQKNTFENSNYFTRDSKSLIVKNHNPCPIYFNNETYKWNRDYSKFTYIAKEKTGKEAKKNFKENDSDITLTLTLTALFVGFGIFVFHRSFYLK
jgi:hypothetical protein